MNPGDIVDRYRIVSLLGQGGMGEVYLAEDTTLGRKVALKFLAPHLVGDDDRIRRFTQEAKAASALNHPNILTIHEIGRAGDKHFLATEFIEGRTLRQRLTTGPVPPREVVDLALQAAAGLVAAHAAGIVHRDIKPDNIMIRSDGYLKILDFGLAKLAEPENETSDAATELAVKTGAGVVMGTARYMSPEQARGRPVDARTDVFSLGAVLYEALAGRPAFDGDTPSHVIVSVLEKDPLPLSRVMPGLPAELERIVSKALSKDPDERFQSVKDLFVDLKRLKQRIDVDAELSRSTPAQGQPSAQPRGDGLRRTWWIAGAAAIALAVAVFALLGRRPSEPPAASASLPAASMSLTRLTNAGTATVSAISPDGRYVVHATNVRGQESLWMRQTATSSNVQIAPPSSAPYTGLSVSPDGNFVLYTKLDQATTQGVLYEMPGLGGPSQRVAERVNGAASLSPDGTRIAFLRREIKAARGASLMVVNRDGTGEREVARVDPPSFFSPPGWSPDGTLIVATEQNFAPTYHGTVIVVPVDGGQKQTVGSKVWFAVRGARWISRDQIAVVASDLGAGLDGRQVWAITYPAGVVRRITNDLNTYTGLSVTADGRSLVTTQAVVSSALWVSADGATKEWRQIATGLGRQDGYRGLTWAPDQRIVFAAAAGNSTGLYIAAADGRDPKLLVSTSTLSDPSVCGAAGPIVYTGDRGEGPRFFRVGIDGQDARQVVPMAASGEQSVACSPNGQWVVYRTYSDGQLWRAGIDGSRPTVLTKHAGGLISNPAVSPDGRSIAYAGIAERQLIVIPADGGPPSRQFRVSPTAIPFIQWTADGAGISYADSVNGVDNIWIQPLSGGPPRQVTAFTSDTIFGHAWSRTGQLLVSRGMIASDVVLIKDW